MFFPSINAVGETTGQATNSPGGLGDRVKRTDNGLGSDQLAETQDCSQPSRAEGFQEPRNEFAAGRSYPLPLFDDREALAGVACKRRQKKYESPLSMSVAAAGASSCGRPPVQSVSRPLRHLVAYGSTNKYRPVNRSKASGNTAKRPTLEGLMGESRCK